MYRIWRDSESGARFTAPVLFSRKSLRPLHYTKQIKEEADKPEVGEVKGETPARVQPKAAQQAQAPSKTASASATPEKSKEKFKGQKKAERSKKKK